MIPVLQLSSPISNTSLSVPVLVIFKIPISFSFILDFFVVFVSLIVEIIEQIVEEDGVG